MARFKAYGSKNYIKQLYKPDQIDFSKNLALQNERVSIAGGQAATGGQNLEDWFQAINTLESLLAGWFDNQYIRECNILLKEKPISLTEKILLGHRLIAALGRLQKRQGFQGEKYGVGSITPFTKGEEKNVEADTSV